MSKLQGRTNSPEKRCPSDSARSDIPLPAAPRWNWGPRATRSKSSSPTEPPGNSRSRSTVTKPRSWSGLRIAGSAAGGHTAVWSLIACRAALSARSGTKSWIRESAKRLSISRPYQLDLHGRCTGMPSDETFDYLTDLKQFITVGHRSIVGPSGNTRQGTNRMRNAGSDANCGHGVSPGHHAG